MGVFKVEQLRALASLFLNCMAGRQHMLRIFRSLLPPDRLPHLQVGLPPRILGVLMAFAGLGWLTFLSPPLANYLSPYIVVLGFLAELSLMLWLLVMGVNVQRWKEQASAARERQ